MMAIIAGENPPTSAPPTPADDPCKKYACFKDAPEKVPLDATVNGTVDFGCNLAEVDKTVLSLEKVQEELEQFDDRDDQYREALASHIISCAMDEFYRESSDIRGKIKEGVDGMHAILKGLSDGVKAIDAELRKAFPDDPPPPAPQAPPSSATPAPMPTPSPSPGPAPTPTKPGG